MQKGDLVSWELARFENKRMEEMELSEDEICRPIRPGHVIMPNQRNFTAFTSLCKKFGGSVTVIKDAETQNALTEIAARFDTCMVNTGKH